VPTDCTVKAKVVWQKATSLGSCRYLLSCHDRHLGFDRNGNIAIRSAAPENHIGLPCKTKHGVDRMTRCEDMAIGQSKFDISRSGAFGTPILWNGRSYRESSILLFERAMLISYRLSEWLLRYLWPFGRNLPSKMSATLKSTDGGPLCVIILRRSLPFEVSVSWLGSCLF